jgi:spermidine/putrescine-binding protein
MAGVLATPSLLAACGGDDDEGAAGTSSSESLGDVEARLAAAQGTVRTLMWDGYINEEAIAPISDRITVKTNSMTLNEDPITKRNIWDIATGVNNIYPAYYAAETMQSLDLDLIPNLDLVSPKEGLWDTEFNVPQLTVYDGEPKGMPFLWGLIAATYNSDEVDEPTTLDDFLKPEFKGKLGIGDDSVTIMIQVSRGLGLGGDRPGFLTSDELDQVMDKLNEFKDHAKPRGIIVNAYGEYAQAYARGEILGAFSDWGPTVQQAQNDGLPVSLALVPETFSWFECLMINKDVEANDAMYALLNQLLDPQAQFVTGRDLILGVVNDDALARLVDEGPGWAAYKDPVALAKEFPVTEWPPVESDEFETFSEWQRRWEEFAAS